MKLKMLSNIINNLLHDKSIDVINIHLGLDEHHNRTIVNRRDLALDENKIEQTINDVLITMSSRLLNGKRTPRVIAVRIYPLYTYGTERVINVEATLGGIIK